MKNENDYLKIVFSYKLNTVKQRRCRRQ